MYNARSAGPMNEEKVQYLEDMRTQLGLTKEVGDKVLKAVRTEVYGSAGAAEDGKWTLDRVLEMHKVGRAGHGVGGAGEGAGAYYWRSCGGRVVGKGSRHAASSVGTTLGGFSFGQVRSPPRSSVPFRCPCCYWRAVQCGWT